jgi:hypothetical protein
MPLCVSCRGEYSTSPGKSQKTLWQKFAAFFEKSAPLPDSKTQQQARKEVTLPWLEKSKDQSQEIDVVSTESKAQSRAEELQPYICSRCRQNNENWDRWSTASGLTHFTRFFLSFWGVLVLLSFLLPAVVAYLVVNYIELFAPFVLIGAILAISLMFFIIAVLYTIRNSLWRYDLLARVGRGLRPTLVLLSVIAFGFAILSGSTSVFVARASIPTPTNTPTVTPIVITNTVTVTQRITVTIIITATPMPTPTPKPHKPCGIRYHCWW